MRVSVMFVISLCIPAFYAEDFRIVDGKKCVVKKRVRQVDSPSTTAAPTTSARDDESLRVSRSFKDHIIMIMQAPFTHKQKETTKLPVKKATTWATTTPVADIDQVDETDSDPTALATVSDKVQELNDRQSKSLTAVLTAHLALTSSVSPIVPTTTADSKGQFLDMGDFDFDDGTGSDSGPEHVKRDFVESTLRLPTTTDSTTPERTTQAVNLGTTSHRMNKVKNQPLIQPWVAVREGQNLRVLTPTTRSAPVTTTTTTTMATTTTSPSTTQEIVEDDTDSVTDSPAMVTSVEPVTIMKKIQLTEQQRSRLMAAENPQKNVKMQETTTMKTSTSSTLKAVMLETIGNDEIDDQGAAEGDRELATTRARVAPSGTMRHQLVVEKRQEAVAPKDSRMVRVVDSDSPQQSVQSSPRFAVASQTTMQVGSLKIAPAVDKGVNTTGMLRVDGPDSPLIDGSYLSDPWMCRVKRDTIKSPIIMETCKGEKKQIVDLRVYKLIGIPTEECITTPVVLGDRCTSLNGGRARCAQRYIRYGLIAQDLDSDRKGHECFRFPSACLCQLILDDTSAVPAPDAVASST